MMTLANCWASVQRKSVCVPVGWPQVMGSPPIQAAIVVYSLVTSGNISLHVERFYICKRFESWTAAAWQNQHHHKHNLQASLEHYHQPPWSPKPCACNAPAAVVSASLAALPARVLPARVLPATQRRPQWHLPPVRQTFQFLADNGGRLYMKT